MPRFFTHNLSGQGYVGESLTAERQRLGLSLEQVSRQLHIPVKYLQALEKGEVETLPGDNYRRYFTRSYANFLHLPVDKILSADKDTPTSAAKLGSRKPIKIASTTVHPYRLLMTVAASGAVVIYLVSAAWSALVPPRLQLFEPGNDQTSLSATVKVRGQTQVGTPIAINGQAVEVSEGGLFTQEVPLKPGLNIIIVTAQKTYSQPTVVTRRVIFSPPNPVSLIK